VTSDDSGTPPADTAAAAPASSASPELPAGTGSVDPADGAVKAKRGSLPVWQESILLLATAVVLAILIKALLVQAFYIPSESMEPGLVQNDRILVQKWSYWAGEPQRGDVVVFADPGGWLGEDDDAGPGNPITKGLAAVGLFPTGGHLVKRVVGVSGDTIVCCDDRGRISVNGQVVEEPFAREGLIDRNPCFGPMTGNCDWTAGPVPDGHVFVLGDNRSQSADSSVHLCSEEVLDCVPGREFVRDDLIVGKVFVLLWPLGRFGSINGGDAYADVPDAS
jgi:signal peptidase I